MHLVETRSLRLDLGSSFGERPGPESAEAHYLRRVGRPELSYLSVAEYLQRRSLFVALTRLSPFEHPALAAGREINSGFPARCLVWHDSTAVVTEATASDLLARDEAVLTARRQVLDAIQTEFDAPRGWPAQSTVRSVERERLRFAASEAARRGIDSRFVLEPMYNAGDRPVRRVDLLERLALDGDSSASADTETDRIGKDLDEQPLYWRQAPADDLPVWRLICEWIAARPGAVASGEQVQALFAQEEQPMPPAARIEAVGLIYYVRGRGRSGWAEEGYHLADGWRTRLLAVEAACAARARR